MTSLLGSLLAYEGDFGVTLGSLWTYRRRFARLMHIISPCVRSKRAHKQEIHVLPTFFAFQGSHEDARESLQFASLRAEPVGKGRGRVNPPPCGLV